MVYGYFTGIETTLSNSNLDLRANGTGVIEIPNNNVVIKIWNKISKNNSLKLLNSEILKKWGTDIIYIAHMAN